MDIGQKTVNNIRILSAEIIQKANSGHPGAPMGMAPIAYALWSKAMNYNSKDSKWANRDRFVLSNGHASALLYTMLHLFGYNVSMEDLKQFRQWGSITPGHPEYMDTDGVETTTGPLGQGIANAVGLAIAETMLAAKFNREGYPIVNHYTYALCGDGCMMEGIASEASSLAGTLKLNKLILLYDDNNITIEGRTDIAFKEDVEARYKAYGWNVLKVDDANDYTQILPALEKAKQSDKPTLIICPTIIGYGCTSQQDKPGVHGSPLGVKGIQEAREFLGVDTEAFGIYPEVYAHTKAIADEKALKQAEWQKMLDAYKNEYPELYEEWLLWNQNELSEEIFKDENLYKFSGNKATRATSGDMINRFAKYIPNLVGGSADLSPSNKTEINGGGSYSAENRAGRILHFGVREHAMAAISNGIALHGGLRVFCGTFLIFSDYMKHSIRLSAMMGLPVTYVLTHDSIGVGEDGATHQPIEQLAGLRAIPGNRVIRPCDGHETAYAWVSALKDKAPTCLILSRQNLPTYDNTGEGTLKGAYVLSPAKKEKPDCIVIASGSEVQFAMEAQGALAEQGIDVSVVSMPSMELFEQQPESYKQSVLPKDVVKRVSIEAASSMPWYKYVGFDGKIISIDKYGASAPAEIIYEKYEITTNKIVETVKSLM
ncbi:MAG: transketolase [Christensenellaceae bacterium]|nr:transketolase [Christensenellaceae bacterium]